MQQNMLLTALFGGRILTDENWGFQRYIWINLFWKTPVFDGPS